MEQCAWCVSMQLRVCLCTCMCVLVRLQGGCSKASLLSSLPWVPPRWQSRASSGSWDSNFSVYFSGSDVEAPEGKGGVWSWE